MSDMDEATEKRPRERVGVRISLEGLAVVDQLAATEERTRSDMIRVLVMEALESRGLIAPRQTPARGARR
ncbi:MAG TPA: hypothetical protein DGT23_18735 [Micromonosporaceae bacterium]|nr:hypothetical protein [Micromonosporaceae bacterium]